MALTDTLIEISGTLVNQALDVAQTAQDIAVDTVKTWTGPAAPFIPAEAGTVVEHAFDVAGQVLASQREFVGRLLSE